MNSASKATIISVGFVGSILLYQVLSNSHRDRIKTRKPTKKQLEQQLRKEIRNVTHNIELSHSTPSKAPNVLYQDAFVGRIVEYLTTFEYLNTICRLSKYHYLFLNHKGIHYDTNRTVTYKMLLNESCLSWNIDKIKSFFHQTPCIDIYKFMYYISNNWKWSGGSKTIKNNRHSEIIQQMICVPYIVPNIHIIKHWFRYISAQLNLPIHAICFKSEMDDNTRNKKHLKHYFVSANQHEHRYELHLFLWIIVYNLYQLYSEINTQTVYHKQEGNMTCATQSAMHSNYFGFEHEVQRWLVNEHHFHFINADISALLKLYHMMIFNKEYHAGSGFNMIFIFCIMFKLILHNTELHIVKLNANKSMNVLEETKQIRDIFLHNLSNIIVFTQYMIERDGNSSFETFNVLLRNVKIPAMIGNILHWFAKFNDNHHVFHICKENPFCMDISPVYFELFCLKTKFYSEHSVLNDQIAIWV
eukprot:243047_1